MADPEGQDGEPRPAAEGRGGFLYDTRLLVALFLVGLALAATGTWQLISPTPAGSWLGRSLPGNDRSLPASIAVPLVLAAVVVLALLVGTMPGRGRRAYRSGLMVVVITLGLVGTGVNVVGPPSLRSIPAEVGDAVQGVLARPENGYPRIKVARVGIDLRLVKGDGRTPPVRYEAFTYPGADHLLVGAPGGGNSYVYAHARHDMFGRLHDLHVGDVIEVDYGGARVLRYRVGELHPGVNWKDLAWLQATSDDRLTLQTCNGWQDADPRFIVVAHRIHDGGLTG